MPDTPSQSDPRAWGGYSPDEWADLQNRAKWGKDQGTDKEGWGAGRFYGTPSFGGGAGTEFGERMRLMAQQNQPAVQMNVSGMQPYLDRSNQSYGQQADALEFLRTRMEGGGPSVAKTQGQVGLDQATAAMMRNRGQPMLPGAGAGLYGAANAGAAARAQEIGGAQKGFMGASGQMRGQTLQERNQNLANAAKYRDIGLSNNQADLERELKLQQMALHGYSQDQAQANAMADIALGLQGDQMQRQQQFLNAGVQAGAGAFGAAGSYFGNSPGGGGGDYRPPQPGGYVGSSDWGSKKGYY